MRCLLSRASGPNGLKDLLVALGRSAISCPARRTVVVGLALLFPTIHGDVRAARIVVYPTLMTQFPVPACVWLTSKCNYQIPPPGNTPTDEQFSFQTQWKFLGDYPYLVRLSYSLEEDDPQIQGGLRRSKSPFIIVGGWVDVDGTQYVTYKFVGSYPYIPAVALQIESQDPKDKNAGELVYRATSPKVSYEPMPAPLPQGLQRIDIGPMLFNFGTDKPVEAPTIGAAGSPSLPNDAIVGALASIPAFRLFGQVGPDEFLFLNSSSTNLTVAGSSGLFLQGEVDAMIYSRASNMMYGVIGNMAIAGAASTSLYYLETLPDVGSVVLNHIDRTLNPNSPSFVAEALAYLEFQPVGNLYDLTGGFTVPVDVTVNPAIITARGISIPEPGVLTLALAAFAAQTALTLTGLVRSRSCRRSSTHPLSIGRRSR